MSDKKHIDRIFQEKLKDLEVTPDAKVWENIQSKLEQPKQDKEKIFPIWLRIGSAAALLLVLLTIGNLYNTNKNNTKTNVVDIENAANPSVNEENNKNANSTNSVKTNNTLVEESNTASKNQEIIVETKNNSEENKKSANSSVASSSSSENSNNKNLNTSFTTNNKKKTTTNKQTPLVVAKNKTLLLNNSKKENVVIPNKNANTIAQNITKTSNNTAGNITELDKNKVATTLKNSTTNTEEENITTDTDTEKEGISIEEEIAKVEDLIEKEEKIANRWQVYANIAPVYYNTLSKGSHIDDQFIDNSKSGEINTSYGVNVSYAFNDKLKLRSGVNSLNLSYDTDNVIIFENVASSNAPALKNINFNNNHSISAISANNLIVQQAVGLLPNENAAISQRIGYYEVPMELEYTLSSKKFGVNVIAGLSTFILNDNKIFSEFDGRKTEIGEANNINNVSFSGNLGLGLDYKFSNKIKFNVQPTFKYQMNAFENTSGNFRPYIIGVYTGLSYKF